MTAKIKRFFASGNTSQGYYSFYDSVLAGLDRLFILKGAPGTGKTTILSDLARLLHEEDWDIEIIHSPRDNEGIDGVLIPVVGLGIVNGSSPISLESKYPLVVEEVFYLDQFVDIDLLKARKDEIKQLFDQRAEAYQSSYAHFAQAKRIHLLREETYVADMDMKKADQITEELMQSMFSRPHSNQEAKQRHLFFGAATPNGVENYIDNLTEDLETRIIVKGRPGSGKSTMITKIANEAHRQGYHTEWYHCSFDPLSLDMVAVPELKIAILDGTPPHEKQPTRAGDQVLDMYSLCFEKDVDEEQSQHLQELNAQYKEEARLGIYHLGEAKRFNDQLKEIYSQAMDFSPMETIRDYILEEVGKLKIKQ